MNTFKIVTSDESLFLVSLVPPVRNHLHVYTVVIFITADRYGMHENARIMMTYDAHNCFARIGTAVITQTRAALWTDGRYFTQATAQMDANWTLMKDGELL